MSLPSRKAAERRMRAEISLKVPVTAVTVLAELATLAPRPELQRLCAQAGEGALDAAQIAKLLPGVSAAGAANLLRSMVGYLLVDARGRLTDHGRRCAKDGVAPVPELGIVQLWYARPPGLDPLPLGFRRVHDARDTGALRPLPPWIAPEPLRERDSHVGEAGRFVLLDLPCAAGQTPLGAGGALRDLTLTWAIDPVSGQNTRRITGDVPVGDDVVTVDVPLPPATQGLAGLAARWLPGWDAATGRRWCAFDDKVPGDAFLRDYQIPTASVPGLDGPVEAILRDVPVGAASADDADRWAMALFVRDFPTKGWLTGAAVEASWRGLSDHPGLARHPPEAPSLDALLAALPTDESRARLAAPVDLALE